MWKWKKAAGLVSLILVLSLLAACSQAGNPPAGQNSPNEGAQPNTPAPSANKRLNYTTSPIGTSVNTIGNGIASVISLNSDVQISVQPVAGMNAWLPLLNSAQSDLGSDAAPEMVWAFEGREDMGYRDAVKDIRLIVRGNFINATGLVVRKDSGIKSVADLKGKRVAYGYPGTAFAKMTTDAVLAANGMSINDVQQVPVATIVAGVEALRDNRVDATFALVPSSPVMLETHNAIGLQELNFIDNTQPGDIDKVSADVMNEITTRIPGAELSVVKPEGYIANETIAIKYPNYLVTSRHVSDDAVYTIMSTLWEHYEKLFPVHPWLQEWTPEQFFDPHPTLPYHPGAVKFLQEKGLWNDEVEKIQQELMNKAS